MHLETLPFLNEIYDKIYSINDVKGIKISKDVDFNFGEKRFGKYNHFINILAPNEEKKINNFELIKQLNNCKEKTHTIFNFSLIPATGSMNNAKQWNEDRLDSFIYYLNLLITEININGAEKAYLEFERLVNSGREIPSKYRLLNSFAGRNGNKGKKSKLLLKKELMQYLSGYKDIYGYCKEWYLLYDAPNENSVRRFIDEYLLAKESAKIIKTCDDVKRYMDIADFYWDIRKKRLIDAGYTEEQLTEINIKIAQSDN